MEKAPFRLRLSTDHPKWSEWMERGVSRDVARFPRLQCLYHYTSLAGFTGIASTRQIWASDARFLNDRTELVHGLEICDRALCRVTQPALRHHVAITRQALREHFGMSPYVACFSETADLESQWTNYADRGKGFAIGMDVACLSWLWAGATALRLMPVVYDEGVQQERADEAVRDASADIDALGGDTSNEFVLNLHARFTKLSVDLLYLCSSFKSRSWSQEREWRLIYHQTDGEKDALSVDRRSNGTIQIPFVRLDLTRTIDGEPRRIFESVREGSLVHPGMSIQVRAMLANEKPQVQWSRRWE